MSAQHSSSIINEICLVCARTKDDIGELIMSPCGYHCVCQDCLASYFRYATENESMYPPRCCDEIFELRTYEAALPIDVAEEFRKKADGEYSVPARIRIYCANAPCSEFLHPRGHVIDPHSDIKFAPCPCATMTCTECRTVVVDPKTHVCKEGDDVAKFKQLASEQGYQKCPHCWTYIELAEACNHITCECGHEFCYVCGKTWMGLHVCPRYGPARYDAEGYNQDGFHRDTGLDRDGLSRAERAARLFARWEEDEAANINRIVHGGGLAGLDLAGLDGGFLQRLAMAIGALEEDEEDDEGDGEEEEEEEEEVEELGEEMDEEDELSSFISLEENLEAPSAISSDGTTPVPRTAGDILAEAAYRVDEEEDEEDEDEDLEFAGAGNDPRFQEILDVLHRDDRRMRETREWEEGDGEI